MAVALRWGMTAHGRTLLLLASLVIVVAGLHFAQEFFVPLLFAAIMTALTSPIVSFATKRGAPPIVGALLALIVDMAVVSAAGILLARAASELQDKVPSYLARISESADAMARALSHRGLHVNSDVLGRALHVDSVAPMLGAMVGTLINAASAVAVVLLLTFFALAEISPLREKLRRMFADPDSGLERVERIVHQVRTYLVVKTLTSLAAAILVFVMLAILHVDLALLLAVIMFLLHFIPNVGFVIAAAPGVLVAFVNRGPGVAVAVAIGYLVAGTVVGNVIEPRVLGRTMGLSPLVVFVSMLFWGFLWGAAGALLAVPLTMVAKIVLENDDEWAFIGQLLEPQPGILRASRMPPDTVKTQKTQKPGATSVAR